MASDEHVQTRETPDGEIELGESYLDGATDPHLVSIYDHRESTVAAARGATHWDTTIHFIFEYKAEQNRLVISRVFAEGENGAGHALDSRPSLIGKYYVQDISKHSGLIDSTIRTMLEDQYGDDVSVDMRTLWDRLRYLTTDLYDDGVLLQLRA